MPGVRCPVAVEGDRVGLKLDSEIWVDARAFEMRVKPIVERPTGQLDARLRMRLRRAIRLYRGEFLANHQQEWVAPERERLRCLYLDALYALADADAAAGDWPSVVVVARQLCAAEPLREDAQRLLMNAYAESGNRALALRQYAGLVETLGTELGVDPMPETVALVKRLGWAAPCPSPATPLTPAAAHEALSASREAVGSALKILDGALSVIRG